MKFTKFVASVQQELFFYVYLVKQLEKKLQHKVYNFFFKNKTFTLVGLLFSFEIMLGKKVKMTLSFPSKSYKHLQTSYLLLKSCSYI